MSRLGEGDEDQGDVELVMREVFEYVGVECEDAELVGTHDPTEKLHYEYFVIQRVSFVWKYERQCVRLFINDFLVKPTISDQVVV